MGPDVSNGKNTKLSKPSALETAHLNRVRSGMADGSIRSIVSGKPAREVHHPLGGMWGSGKGLKAHDWFVIPLTFDEHRQYHLLGKQSWETRYGTHEMLLKAFWAAYGITPGEWMTEGMDFRRAEWCRRVLERI